MGKKSTESTHSNKKKDDADWKSPPKKRAPSPPPLHYEQPQPCWEPEPTLRIYDPSPNPRPSRRYGMHIGAHWLALFFSLFLILFFVNVSYTTIGLYNSLPRQLVSPDYPQREFLPMPYPIQWSQYTRPGQSLGSFGGQTNADGPIVGAGQESGFPFPMTSTSVVQSTVMVSKTTTIVTGTPAPPSNAELAPALGDDQGKGSSATTTSQSTSSTTSALRVITSTFIAPASTTTSVVLITETPSSVTSSTSLPSGARNPSEQNHRSNPSS